VPITCNGILAGLVAITGAADTMMPWAAIIFSLLGGVAYFGFSLLVKKLRIDDALDAGPLHGGVGIFGTILTGFVDQNKGLFYGHGGTGFLV
jgi:Amt family ammonium transporter